MSHESHNTRPRIDINHPYLMLRSDGTIDVSHVDVDENGYPLFDANGKVTLASVKPSVVDGETMVATKSVDPRALSLEVQGKLADSLAEGQVFDYEAYDDGAEADEIGHAVLDAVGVDQPVIVDESEDSRIGIPIDTSHQEKVAELQEKVELTLKLIDDTMPILKGEVDGLVSRIDVVGQHIQAGMNNDDSDRWAIGDYVASIDSIGATIHDLSSRLNGLRYESERLEKDEKSSNHIFGDESDAAKVCASLLTARNDFDIVVNTNPEMIATMRRFINAYEQDDITDAATRLQQIGRDGWVVTQLLIQQDFAQRFSEI